MPALSSSSKALGSVHPWSSSRQWEHQDPLELQHPSSRGRSAGSRAEASAFSSASPGIPNPQSIAGPLAEAPFCSSPLPPAAPSRAPTMGTQGCLSPEPRQVPLKLLLLSLEVLDVFHLGTTRRQRGTSARGTGMLILQAGLAPLPLRGSSPRTAPRCGFPTQEAGTHPDLLSHPTGSPGKEPDVGE